MDSDKGRKWGGWSGDKEFYEFVQKRGKEILKEKRQREKLPAHTEWVAAHTEWTQDEVTSSWVPEPAVDLYEREVDLVTGDRRRRCSDSSLSKRWLPVKARAVDCVRMTYNRSEIVEGGRNVTENEWWWGDTQEGDSNQGMVGGEGEASGGMEECILSDGGEEGEASGEPIDDARVKPMVEFILSDIGEEGAASADDSIADAGEDAGEKTRENRFQGRSQGQRQGTVRQGAEGGGDTEEEKYRTW